MNCPKCNINLAISFTNGIEIDYCPSCRGVWLDRGELEKIIERSSGSDHKEEHVKYDRPHKEHDYHEKQGGYGHYGKRKKGFLEDLFDF